MTKSLGSGPLAGMPRFESARARLAGRFGDSVLDTPLLAAFEGVRFMGDDVPGWPFWRACSSAILESRNESRLPLSLYMTVREMYGYGFFDVGTHLKHDDLLMI
jgi:hypothetical protein